MGTVSLIGCFACAPATGWPRAQEGRLLEGEALTLIGRVVHSLFEVQSLAFGAIHPSLSLYLSLSLSFLPLSQHWGIGSSSSSSAGGLGGGSKTADPNHVAYFFKAETLSGSHTSPPPHAFGFVDGGGGGGGGFIIHSVPHVKTRALSTHEHTHANTHTCNCDDGVCYVCAEQREWVSRISVALEKRGEIADAQGSASAASSSQPSVGQWRDQIKG